MSVEHYIRLERGNLGGVSDSVLDALAGEVGSARRRGRNVCWFAASAGRPRSILPSAHCLLPPSPWSQVTIALWNRPQG